MLQGERKIHDVVGDYAKKEVGLCYCVPKVAKGERWRSLREVAVALVKDIPQERRNNGLEFVRDRCQFIFHSYTCLVKGDKGLGMLGEEE